ncbi:peroxidasin-like [Mizuhopecten yessoensis]|uniref:Peroxidasin n=1 Tax=Mizuhopecten yessoensis TaxID=6573 RepID=A0A210QL07_MIZYE|nr:peroxidasin-like [Mizuhopecten yessoensis]OWF49432.1 Peroxidasin [Mizuhopecten yessoensis]
MMAYVSLCCLAVTLFCCIATNNANIPHEREVELELAERILDLLEDNEKRMNKKYPDQTPEDLVAEAERKGQEALTEDYELKYHHYVTGTDKLSDGTSYADAQAAVAYIDYTPAHAEELDNKTTVALNALKYILDETDISLDDLLKADHQYKKGILEAWEKTFHPEKYRECTVEEKNAAYRPIDGSCNNVDHYDWGKSITARSRFISKPAYSDQHGLTSPRKAKNGNELPSARSVSIAFARYTQDLENTPLDDLRTVALTGWGQYLDHEITDTALSSGYGGAVIECCPLSKEERAKRPQCIDIAIPEDDPKFTNDSCMECVRSAGTLTDFRVPGPRQQINDITAFIDGSSSYGSEDERADELKDKTTGKLLEKRPGFPPEDTDPDACVKKFTLENYYCPKAGDRRSSDISHLTVYHVLFLRVHNDLVEKLQDMHSNWKPERLYQEARKIVGAILQQITYNEWLPLFIGQDMMRKHKLTLGGPFRYDKNLNPSITNELATAALRIGHTLVTGSMKRMNSSFDIMEEQQNRNAFLDPYLTFRNAPEVMRWMTTAPAQKSDRFINLDFIDFLFSNVDASSPLDLMSLNIQRGRDHGLASYADVYEKCGFGTIDDWDSLNHHTLDVREALKKAYPGVSAKDIDLFPAGISETITDEGGQLGPTFACIFADQFKRIKFGDRFWYENDKKATPGSKAPFKSSQIEAIREVKLSKLICQHYGLTEIQEDAFIQPGVGDRKSCSDIPGLDLTPWTKEGED